MRKRRELIPGATYYVIASINTGRNALRNYKFKKIFLNVVRRCKKKYKFKLKNFTILHDKIEFLIKPIENSSLSRIMQWILSVFAMKYNKITHTNGHVWRSRFWSKIVKNIKELVKIFNNISHKAVNHKIVNYPEEYIYCGLYFILKKIFDIIERPSSNYLLEEIINLIKKI